MASTDIVVFEPPTSPQPPTTPPESRTSPSFPLFVAVDDLKQLVVGFIKKAQKAKSTDKVEASASVAEKDVLPARSKARASRLEYKIVDERYSPPQLQTYVVKLITMQLK